MERQLASGAQPGALDKNHQTPVHRASYEGHGDVAARLLLAAPAAALLRDGFGATPLMAAIDFCRTDVALRLLEAAPAAAAVTTHDGCGPLHYLCTCEETPSTLELARRLLAAAPHMAAAANSNRELPIHLAARHGRVGVIRLLLEAAPATATGRRGGPPIIIAAWSRQPAAASEMVRLLLAAAPKTADSRGHANATPLHAACAAGNAEAAQLIAQAAPATAQVRTTGGWEELPLTLALKAAAAILDGSGEAVNAGERPLEHYSACIQTLLPLTPPDMALPLLTSWPKTPSVRASQPFLTDYLALWPLSSAQWELVPTPCPGLGRALPAVLARSDAEAAQLVARLPDSDRSRLRTFALCLHCCQRCAGVQLPPVLVHRILSLFDA